MSLRSRQSCGVWGMRWGESVVGRLSIRRAVRTPRPPLLTRGGYHLLGVKLDLRERLQRSRATGLLHVTRSTDHSFPTMERRTNEANHGGIGLAATLERNPSDHGASKMRRVGWASPVCAAVAVAALPVGQRGGEGVLMAVGAHGGCALVTSREHAAPALGAHPSHRGGRGERRHGR